MKKLLSAAVCLAMLAGMLSGCGSNTQQSAGTPDSTGAAQAGADSSAAPADSTSKTKFRILYASEYTTLNYLVTGDSYEQKVAGNTVDSLTEHDKYGVIIPCLAESWTHNDDNTVWTFKIRQGVKWVDYQGNEVADVTANDWVTSAQYVNDAHHDSSLQYMYSGVVKNADEYYSQTAEQLEAENAVTDGTAASVDDYYKANNIDSSKFITPDAIGVKALDDYTLEYTMASPCPYFLSVLSYTSYYPVYGPFLEEQGDNFGIDNESLLYCGAYIFSQYEPNSSHVFTANPTYWDADKVYIKELDHIYNADEATLGPSMFQRGEIDQATIGVDILDQWMNGADTKNLVHGSQPVIAYSYFFSFNFEPRVDAEDQPDNWIKAVNNEDFRQAIFHSIDRVKALAVQDPYEPEKLVNNTITPATFTVANGTDYTQFAPLKAISDGNNFDEDLAKQYAAKAKEELTAEGVTFPVKALMPYNPNTTSWDKECQVIEQQVEGLLGSDFIDIIPQAGPSTGFLTSSRRSGDYELEKCNWGADYADPQTWTDPFKDNNSYNFMYTSDDLLGDEPKTNKSEETQALVSQYYDLVAKAKAETTDENARYTAFATAEQFLIQHALIVPFSVDTDSYVASYIDPFSSEYAPYGIDPFKYKGQKMLDKPLNEDEYTAAYQQWKTEWAQAQAASSAE